MDSPKSDTEAFTEEPTSWHYIFTLPFYISFFITFLIPTVISPALGKHYTPEKYSNLGGKKGHFDTLLSSTIHAVAVSSLTGYLLVTGGMGTNLVFSKSPIGFAVMQISLGYFVSDFIVCLMDKDLRSDLGSLAHHIAGMVGIALGLYHQGKFMFFIVFRLISEVSTPFVNLFWILTMLKRRDSPLFVFASFGMLITFFVFRLSPLYWLWQLLVVTLLDPASAIVPAPLRLWTVFNYVVFDILNVFWFWKMVKGAAKKLISMRKKSS